MQGNTAATRRLVHVAMTVLAAATTLAASPASAQTPDYSLYTTARFIPFAPDTANPPWRPFTNTVHFQVAIGGRTALYTMDTGTTGIVISAADLVGYRPSPRDSAGYEFLSSSKVLWVGRWVPMDVVFLDSTRVPVVAHVPVLVTEQTAVCPEWKASDGPRCPTAALEPARPGIHYMGVGFGREYDGQPQGTPDKNPFLNVVRIGTEPVRPGSIRAGYVITPGGVHLGLTPGNTAGFAFAPLTARSGALHDWAEAPMCVEVDGSRCLAGAVLIDTGINSMYISTPAPATSVPTRNPNIHDRVVLVPALAAGTRVTVRIPGQQAQIGSYSFAAGDTTSRVAPALAMRTADAAVFVNTGRHFYRAFDVLYDADGGFFGLRRITAAAEPNDPTSSGTR